MALFDLVIFNPKAVEQIHKESKFDSLSLLVVCKQLKIILRILKKKLLQSIQKRDFTYPILSVERVLGRQSQGATEISLGHGVSLAGAVAPAVALALRDLRRGLYGRLPARPGQGRPGLGKVQSEHLLLGRAHRRGLYPRLQLGLRQIGLYRLHGWIQSTPRRHGCRDLDKFHASIS